MGCWQSKFEKVDSSVMTKGFFDLEENCVDEIAVPFSNLKNDKVISTNYIYDFPKGFS